MTLRDIGLCALMACGYGLLMAAGIAEDGWGWWALIPGGGFGLAIFLHLVWPERKMTKTEQAAAAAKLADLLDDRAQS